ncbi:TMEM165/GDT1 family protein [Methylophaga sp. SB9B]|uniref:TMEM165/GDT1 family protein n=1 Tax=Methylophaga sp. SB9B TaxID=2570356 RepID=UPI0010A7F4A1|nr:TMEM165/GDT1 family protein [Methylophaga sp. SB9B]THK43211.1 TMEM165/GDT1 family protein [Methylophaga sp. SB9B]
MEAFFVSTTTVALAEIGDKTQLLSLFLAARFRAPIPIIFGILVATLLNHGLSAWLGVWITEFISPQTGQLLIGISFIAVALWILIPDKEEDASSNLNRYGAFVATLVLFFLAEIGDKTQIATVILAAQYQQFFLVTLGTTIGMMLANVPVVLFGNQLMQKLPLNAARYAASSVFMVLGLLTFMF